jgi:hypothetical protein
MKRNILILSCLCILLVFPNLALAECAEFGGFTDFYLAGGNTVILYGGEHLSRNLMFRGVSCCRRPTFNSLKGICVTGISF